MLHINTWSPSFFFHFAHFVWIESFEKTRIFCSQILAVKRKTFSVAKLEYFDSSLVENMNETWSACRLQKNIILFDILTSTAALEYVIVPWSNVMNTSYFYFPRGLSSKIVPNCYIHFKIIYLYITCFDAQRILHFFFCCMIIISIFGCTFNKFELDFFINLTFYSNYVCA